MVDKQKRRLLKLLSAAAISQFCFGANALSAGKTNTLLKQIPTSGESISPIGMGTWITFNVGNDIELRNQCAQVLNTFFALGGQMVDSSPMYGSSEAVLGYCFEQLNNEQNLFAATKTWTSSVSTGKQQFADSQNFWRQAQFDLLQVHNLVNWQQHLPVLQEFKRDRLVRYIGVTTSHGRRHSELIKIMKSQPIDFIQLTYNMLDREAEQQVLPLAQDRGIAVIANRPFQGGRLMDRFSGEKLPNWAADVGCFNWAQFFLRFIISHPAMTCAIPATSQVVHMKENMAALNDGPLANEKQRQQMLSYLATL